MPVKSMSIKNNTAYNHLDYIISYYHIEGNLSNENRIVLQGFNMNIKAIFTIIITKCDDRPVSSDSNPWHEGFFYIENNNVFYLVDLRYREIDDNDTANINHRLNFDYVSLGIPPLLYCTIFGTLVCKL